MLIGLLLASTIFFGVAAGDADDKKIEQLEKAIAAAETKEQRDKLFAQLNALLEAMKPQRETFAEALIKKFDKNGDGKLDENERPSGGQLREFYRSQLGDRPSGRPGEVVEPKEGIPNKNSKPASPVINPVDKEEYERNREKLAKLNQESVDRLVKPFGLIPANNGKESPYEYGWLTSLVNDMAESITLENASKFDVNTVVSAYTLNNGIAKEGWELDPSGATITIGGGGVLPTKKVWLVRRLRK